MTTSLKNLGNTSKNIETGTSMELLRKGEFATLRPICPLHASTITVIIILHVTTTFITIKHMIHFLFPSNHPAAVFESGMQRRLLLVTLS